jgi:hypothetical protein
MVIEVTVSLFSGFAVGYLFGKRAVAALKLELEKVVVEAEKIGKTEVASVLTKLKSKL